jgi:outer membrane protein OmpU
MKFTTLAVAMLATTALTTTASAELSIAGSARIGVQQAEKTTANAAATTAVNRVRIEFTATGSTDASIDFGATIRADEAVNGNTGTAGSQWVSGAFGKISMGDLDGADEIAVGDVSGVGIAGLGDNNELAYQSSGHNLGWQIETMGFTSAYSMNTASNSHDDAVGFSYSRDIGTAAVNVGVGRSQIGTATQTSYGAGMTMAGITAKVAQSEDDNGTAADVEETAISVSYNISALTGTVFQKDVATVGSADTSYTGFGVEYDLGGATAKIGVMNDDAKRQWIDAGISFSF